MADHLSLSISANPLSIEHCPADCTGIRTLARCIDASAAINEKDLTIIGYEEEASQTIGLIGDVVASWHLLKIGNAWFGIGDDVASFERRGLGPRKAERSTTTIAIFATTTIKDPTERAKYIIGSGLGDEHKGTLTTLQEPAEAAHNRADGLLTRQNLATTGELHFDFVSWCL
jgi:hypothetical protein